MNHCKNFPYSDYYRTCLITFLQEKWLPRKLSMCRGSTRSHSRCWGQATEESRYLQPASGWLLLQNSGLSWPLCLILQSSSHGPPTQLPTPALTHCGREKAICILPKRTYLQSRNVLLNGTKCQSACLDKLGAAPGKQFLHGFGAGNSQGNSSLPHT